MCASMRATQLMACFVTQSRTDCGPEKMTTEERDAVTVRLTHILTAYAYIDPVVGYCQGKHYTTLRRHHTYALYKVSTVENTERAVDCCNQHNRQRHCNTSSHRTNSMSLHSLTACALISHTSFSNLRHSSQRTPMCASHRIVSMTSTCRSSTVATLSAKHVACYDMITVQQGCQVSLKEDRLIDLAVHDKLIGSAHWTGWQCTLHW